ncbi:MAG TPA: hypothetical protein VMU69_22905, partial [Bradyrhizobium sp.]|nr:hypothetical protein [Bradyrhizobium sp.]
RDFCSAVFEDAGDDRLQAARSNGSDSNHRRGRLDVICPAGCSADLVSSPRRKKILLPRAIKSVL